MVEKGLMNTGKEADQEDLISRLVHDLKGPVTAVHLKVQLARRLLGEEVSAGPSRVRVTELLANAQGELNRLTEILDQFRSKHGHGVMRVDQAVERSRKTGS